MKKRFLSFMLVAAMLLSFMPVMAFADAQKIGDSNVTWALSNENTVLTISGTGAMPDFADASEQPWRDNRNGIQSVVIESGVTSVGNHAFDEFGSVSLTLPDGWQGDLPDGNGIWYGADDVTLPSYPKTVQNVKLQQRYPWDGKVYITADVTGSNELNVAVNIYRYDRGEWKSPDSPAVQASVNLGDGMTTMASFLWDANTGLTGTGSAVKAEVVLDGKFVSTSSAVTVYRTANDLVVRGGEEVQIEVDPVWTGGNKATVSIKGEASNREYEYYGATTDAWDTTGLTPGKYELCYSEYNNATATFWVTDDNWVVLNEKITVDRTFESTKTYLVLGTVEVDSGVTLTVKNGAKFFYGTASDFNGSTPWELPNKYERFGDDNSFKIVEKEPGTEDNPWNVGTSGHESEVNAYVTPNVSCDYLHITGAGIIGSLSAVPDKNRIGHIIVSDATITGAASNVFAGFKNVSLTLPAGWPGDLPNEGGKWYGANGVTLKSYPNTVRNVTFQQRYPWNGKVDITTEIRGAGALDITVAAFKKKDSAWEPIYISAILGETSINLGEGAIESFRFVWDAAEDLNNEVYDIYVEVGLVGKVSGSSIEGKVDLRTSVALPEGATTVAGVTWSDTAWTGEGNANVSIGWKKAGTSDVGSLAEGRLGEGVGEFYLPKRDGAYTLTHSTGSLESFVTYTVSGYPVKNITNGTAADAKGSISIGTTSAVVSETVTVTVNPDSGYVLKDLTVFKTDASTTTIAAIKKSDSTYEFTMPAYDVTVKAEFELAPITNVDITIGTVSLDTVKGLGDESRPTISVVDNSTATNLLNQKTNLYDAYLMDSKGTVLYSYNTGLLYPADQGWYSYDGSFKITDYANVKFDKVEKISLRYCIGNEEEEAYNLPASNSDLAVKVNNEELPISEKDNYLSSNFRIVNKRITVCYVCDISKSSPSYYIIVERNESNYAVAAEVAKNGTVTVDKSSVAADGTVTITVAPDKGFVIDALTVLDANGKEVGVNNLGNNKYSFTMPKSNVSVKASFVKEQTVVNSFVDVKEGDYFYDAVLWAIENGITDGVDATHFNPSGITNRAQMVTFLWRAAGCPEPTLTKCPFADVETGSYYDKAVLWAYENGITDGTTATTFEPNKNVNRAQVVTFLWRYSGGLSVDYWMQMSDVASGQYYTEAVRWALAEKITDGTSKTTFSPEDDCLRGQAVTFLYRGFGE
ncbi:MAG: S-layer homology domain-containing protein [Clostridia bacterium]|nr:S-layer homology domain-containing protein [Clostridia bacterium]